MQGVATPGIFASTVAYIHEVWPPSHAGRATAAYMTGTILGGFTGRAVSGLVAADVSWQAAFVALAILTGGVAAALTMWLPREPARSRGARREGRPRIDRRTWSATGGWSRPAASASRVLFTQVAMFTYVTFHLAAPPFSLSTVALGWLFVVYLVGAVVTPFAGRWIDRLRAPHRASRSAMAIGGAGALLTLVPWLPAIVAGLALCATGVFTAQATTSSYIGAVTTSDRALAVGHVLDVLLRRRQRRRRAAVAVLGDRRLDRRASRSSSSCRLVGVAIALTQWSAASRRTTTWCCRTSDRGQISRRCDLARRSLRELVSAVRRAIGGSGTCRPATRFADGRRAARAARRLPSPRPRAAGA